MGRQNRSRKRRDEMNRIKRERYAAKELQMLKKTLGLIDADGNEVMKEVKDVVTIKTAKELKKDKKIREGEEYSLEIEEEQDKGENVTVFNKKSGKKQTFNTKTMKDKNGAYPVWYNSKKTLKRTRKLNHARKQRFRQQWTTVNVPL